MKRIATSKALRIVSSMEWAPRTRGARMRQILYPNLIPSRRKWKSLNTHEEGSTWHCSALEGKVERRRVDAGRGGRGSKGMVKSICTRQGCRSGVCFRTSRVSLASGDWSGGNQRPFRVMESVYILIGVVVTWVSTSVKTLQTILFECVSFIVCKLCLTKSRENRNWKQSGQ